MIPRRSKLATIPALVALVGFASTAVRAQVVRTDPRAPRPTTPQLAPEPAGVYGWIAIVDPGTGERWLPLDYEYDPPRLFGYPVYISVLFRRIGRNDSIAVSFGASEGLTADRARNAWRYAIRFQHVSTMTGPPARSESGTLRYNPSAWRFVRVAVGEYRWSVREQNATRVLWQVPFAPRPQPFADLAGVPPGG
jgi:hypothetical protein